jgi:hypothetical protein
MSPVPLQCLPSIAFFGRDAAEQQIETEAEAKAETSRRSGSSVGEGQERQQPVSVRKRRARSVQGMDELPEEVTRRRLRHRESTQRTQQPCLSLPPYRIVPSH